MRTLVELTFSLTKSNLLLFETKILFEIPLKGKLEPSLYDYKESLRSQTVFILRAFGISFLRILAPKTIAEAQR